MKANIRKMYIIDSQFNLHFDGLLFNSKEDAEKAINELAKQRYSDKSFKLLDRKDRSILIVKNYWRGGFSVEEANEKIKKHIKSTKKDITVDDVWTSALFYDFIDSFYVRELTVVDNMDKLVENIKKI